VRSGWYDASHWRSEGGEKSRTFGQRKLRRGAERNTGLPKASPDRGKRYGGNTSKWEEERFGRVPRTKRG